MRGWDVGRGGGVSPARDLGWAGGRWRVGRVGVGNNCFWSDALNLFQDNNNKVEV